jgi:hypothetical protein
MRLTAQPEEVATAISPASKGHHPHPRHVAPHDTDHARSPTQEAVAVTSFDIKGYRPRRIQAVKILCFTLALICSLAVLRSLWFDVSVGGNEWKQGDWLINAANDPIRRGLFGSAILVLSDGLHTSPVVVTAILQLTAFMLLVASTLITFNRLLDDPIYVVILLSPAFYFVFWAVDVHGSMRKEVIAFAAMSLLLLVPLIRTGKLSVVVASAVLFILACTGHEANVLLTPAYAAIYIAAVRPSLRSRWLLPLYILFAAAVLAVIGYTLTNITVGNSQSVCEPLLMRGIDPRICGGAITWLDTSSQDAMGQVAESLSPTFMLSFLLMYVFAAVPIVYLLFLHEKRERLILAFFLFLIPILPLYIVAFDWGRWMSLHVVSFSFFLSALVLTGTVSAVRPAKWAALGLIAGVSLLWAPDHEMGGVITGGLVEKLVLAVGDAF